MIETGVGRRVLQLWALMACKIEEEEYSSRKGVVYFSALYREKAEETNCQKRGNGSISFKPKNVFRNDGKSNSNITNDQVPYTYICVCVCLSNNPYRKPSMIETGFLPTRILTFLVYEPCIFLYSFHELHQ